ncbi:MAG: ABC transporter ATP-binding protein [Anaerolineae bacterium]|nr:ABC transporter ATP-binding protein [Anaerolineae bacterium]
MTATLKFLSKKSKNALAQLPYLKRALGLVWSASRGWTLVWLGLLVGQGVLPAATVYLTRTLVNHLVPLLDAPHSWSGLRPVLLTAALMGLVLLLTEVLRSISGWVRTVQAELVTDYISGLIHTQSTALDLAFYESPDYYDHLHRAKDDAGYRTLALLEHGGSLLQNGLTLITMALILIPYGWWLPLALLLSTLPAFGVVLHYTLKQHQWRVQTTAVERRVWYYDWLLTGGETAAELRLFGLSGYFQTAFQGLRRQLRQGRLKLAQDQIPAELGAGLVALLITGLSMVWMLWRLVESQLTLGDLVLFYQAFNQGQALMRSLLGEVSQIYYNLLFLSDLFEFLALEPAITDPPQPASLGNMAGGVSARFEQVTFHYPGSERYALQDLNLTIAPGQIVAIVGTNGAGKSTLTKLLCRFYDPTAGRIELNGVDLRRLPLAELRRRITILFQQPVQYNATIAENIRLGDIMAAADSPKIETAARAAGAHQFINHLPEGYETLLGKWFAGGTELSGGEWQRIALARAFLRQASLIILDEPTSAMDSWAEADWLSRFRALAAGRTTLIITHRFTTAMQADIIHVMDHGRIVESGSHSDLLQLNGRYAQSWRSQLAAGPDRRPKPAYRNGH